MKPFRSSRNKGHVVFADLAADGANICTGLGAVVRIGPDDLGALAKWCSAARAEIEPKPKLRFSATDEDGCTLSGGPSPTHRTGTARVCGHDSSDINRPVDINAQQLRRLAAWAIASAERLENES